MFKFLFDESHTDLKILAILWDTICLAGATVLNAAQITDMTKIKIVYSQGNSNKAGKFTNISYYKVIVKPIISPIRTPNKDADITRMNASYI